MNNKLEQPLIERNAMLEKELAAKNRELEIESALEKVRAISLSMKEPADMLEVCRIIAEQLETLDIKDIRNIQTAIIYESKGTYLNFEYYRLHNKTFITEVDFKLHPTQFEFVFQMLKGSEEYFTKTFKGQEVKDWYEYQKTTNQFADSFLAEATSLNYYWYSTGPVALGISTYSPLSDDELKIFKRFRNVFELAYRRFMDIELAIAQARESQIQLAMERVRARTMAMQKSDELADVAGLLFKQVSDLGIAAWTTGFNVWSEDNNFYTDYITSPLGGFIAPYKIDTAKAELLTEVSDARKSGQEFLIQYAEGERLKEAYIQLAAFGDEMQYDKMLEDGVQFPSHQYDHFVFGSKVSLMFITYEPVPEAHDIFKRFGKVFEQTYTRFLDLQKAEALAMEAEIELGLERVRARAMAMHTSQELIEVALELRKQMGLLGQKDLEVCAIHLYGDDEYFFESWSAMKAPGLEGDILQTQARFPKKGIRIIDELMKHYTNRSKDYILVNNGEKITEWFKVMKDYAPELYASITQSIGNIPLSTLKANWSVADFSGGALVMVTYGEPDMSSRNLLRRSANVFEQAYIRFLDLQKAEAQAREAQIELALERVRSRAMAMQTSDDLNALIGLVFAECTKLDLVLDRCIVMIINPQTLDSNWILANPELPKQPSNYLVKYHEHPPYLAYIDAWKNRVQRWHYQLGGMEKQEWDAFLFAETGLANLPAAAKDAMRSVKSIQLYSSFSNFGNLTLSCFEPLTDGQMDILVRFAKVFDLTYTRFSDLKIAEAYALQAKEDLIKLQKEKKRAEDALTELQATQKQLVQSEKMASLGELTAGIAHEIQNPLNFVNNFSEVNTELIDELKNELAAGNLQFATEIADNIKANEQKINHHGKRADAIVKGMLQHSRTSNGIEEPTDINALCDEYIRLSYHGLRAKDKSFNATIKTNFDSSIGHINIIPQDIGRVILNLLTNAFYVVNEKKQQNHEGYEPTVSISTKKLGDKIFISVKDNGNGIPQKVLDKIFQPFFTTKPTGQGTGLGLSLSYDIITKGHGGELKVETKENEGTTFVIQIPV